MTKHIIWWKLEKIKLIRSILIDNPTQSILRWELLLFELKSLMDEKCDAQVLNFNNRKLIQMKIFSARVSKFIFCFSIFSIKIYKINISFGIMESWPFDDLEIKMKKKRINILPRNAFYKLICLAIIYTYRWNNEVNRVG